MVAEGMPVFLYRALGTPSVRGLADGTQTKPSFLFILSISITLQYKASSSE